jgi:hypothetical protein
LDHVDGPVDRQYCRTTHTLDSFPLRNHSGPVTDRGVQPGKISYTGAVVHPALELSQALDPCTLMQHVL